jgi:hypothetical protein
MHADQIMNLHPTCHGRQPGVLGAGSAGPSGLGLGLSPFLEVKEVPLFKERGCINLGKQYQTNQSSFSSNFSNISSSFSTISSPAIRHLAGNYPPRPKGCDNLVSEQYTYHCIKQVQTKPE